MTEDLIRFSAPMPERGYQWVDAQETGDERDSRFLVPIAGPNRIYNPAQETGLFKTFAECKPDEESLLKFANRYGALGLSQLIELPQVELDPVNLPVSLRKKLAGKYAPVRAGERFTTLCSELGEMRRYVRLWDAAQKGNQKLLSKFVHWVHEERVDYWRVVKEGVPPEAEVIASRDQSPPELLLRNRFPDLIQPAITLVERHVNRKLRQHGVTADLLWNEVQGVGLHIVPKNLAGFLWLQFAQAIAGDREYRKCKHCTRWFQSGGSKSTRSDRQFCSASCKSSAHQMKQRRARQLAADGMDLESIAATLETDVETLKGWLKK